ncbi:MAG: putative sulfate exporter family transporter [Sinobacteraceae bacterium]|nr:putative sulfate exporter family transporter [Nevskiaceae bacterium]
MELKARTFALAPGLLVTCAVAAAALAVERIQAALIGRTWIEALVIAILLGATVRTFWIPGLRFKAGINFATRIVLEIAVALMGATVSVAALAGIGGELVVAIVLVVACAIATSFLIGRLFGLPAKMAALIACGNAICGNSAIAAVAPAIDAEHQDVATAIAFTAVLGIVVIIALPVVALHSHLSARAGGVLAGLTVYAVPQVLAAAAPMGSAAVQTGALVKLVRVLMLGPVTACAALLANHRSHDRQPQRLPVRHFLRAFILVFMLLAGVNSAGLISGALGSIAQRLSLALTIVAMAALGLGVDLRSVRRAGLRVMIVTTASIAMLGTIAFGLLKLLNIT